jgi:UDP:flavonoid glycosyltransferase YjiC (YdhE family)
LKRNCEVVIGGSGESLELLKADFPGLKYFNLPGYRPVYASNGNMVVKMLQQLPKFVSVIREEHRVLESIVQSEGINIVISDNRYGCWSALARSVFITHQLNILLPRGLNWLSPAVNYFNHKLIRKFSNCWVPDFKDDEQSLAGKLSVSDIQLHPRVTYIGPLSRFAPTSEVANDYDVACILSGPEPQRSIMENLVLPQLRQSGLRYVVAKGKFANVTSTSPREVDFMGAEKLRDAIASSSIVIARSGYSTLMDLSALGKKAIVVPTPGQTEQEYLADRWDRRDVVYAVRQDKFDLQAALRDASNRKGFSADRKQGDLFGPAIDSLISQQ